MDAFIWKLAEVRQDFIKVIPEVHILFDGRLDSIEG